MIENKVGAKGTGRSIEETERSKKRGTERLGVDAVENSQAIPSTIYKSFYIICLSSMILSPLNGNVKMSPRETGDIHLSTCLHGELACAKAAELLSLSVRQVKRLKSEGHRGFRRSAEVHRRIGAREICDAQRVCVQE